MCAAGGNPKECFNKKTCGAVQDDSFCGRCLVQAKGIQDEETGTWMSVYSDRETNILVVKAERNCSMRVAGCGGSATQEFLKPEVERR